MRSLAALSLLLIAPGVSLAQRADPPPIGTRIRATPKMRADPYIMGQLVAQSGDTIVIQLPDSEKVRMSLASLSRLEVSDGQRGDFWKGAGWGFLIGGAGGAVIGAVAIEDPWKGIGALLGAGTGGLLGLLIGGGIGSNIITEHWKPAPGWELSLSVQPTATGVRIAIRF
jgi:hypothetical protein